MACRILLNLLMFLQDGLNSNVRKVPFSATMFLTHLLRSNYVQYVSVLFQATFSTTSKIQDKEMKLFEVSHYRWYKKSFQNKCQVPKFSFSGRFSSSTPRHKCHPVWVFKGGEIVSVILHPTISVVGLSRQRTFCIQQKSSSKY